MDTTQLQITGLDLLQKGYSVVPINGKKVPLVKWKEYQGKRMESVEIVGHLKRPESEGLGIVCGPISKGLEVIDIDLKYDLTRTLWEDLRKVLEDNIPKVLGRLVIVETRSKGIHLYYRTDSPEGNQKLAYREPTEEERKNGEKKLVLIETRGTGGYIVTPPTPGYTYLQGSIDSIPTLSLRERSLLLSLCKSFNTLLETDTDTPEPSGMSTYGLSPWVDYNERGDVRRLLEESGWNFVESQGPKDYYLRPGKTDSKTSGNFHNGLRVFFVWSTSTELEEGRGYNPSTLYKILKGIDDWKEVYKQLRDEGYGDTYTPVPNTRETSYQAEESSDPWGDKYGKYLRFNNEEEIFEEMERTGNDIRTGYTMKHRGEKTEILLPSGGLTIVSARTSHRKTGLMLNLAKNVIDHNEDTRTVFLTIEETSGRLLMKFLNLCVNTQLSTHYKNNYRFLKSYYKKEKDLSPELEKQKGPFYDKYINTGAVRFYYYEEKIQELVEYLSQLRDRNPSVRVVFIDYIQLIRTNVSYPTRQVAIFEICEELRKVANLTGLALVLGAQFNRMVKDEESIDSSHIREAGDIEQTANLALGLWDRSFNEDPEDQLFVKVMKGRDIGVGWEEVFNYNPNSGRIYDNL